LREAACLSIKDVPTMSSMERETDPETLENLRAAAGGRRIIPLEEFIRCALYHPRTGYYTRPRERVGRRPATDFYTAASLGPVFSKLVLAAVRNLGSEPLESFTFVEVGPESGGGILASAPESPFAGSRLIRPVDDFDIPARSILFSNELFDAQPFRRLVHSGGRWLEMAVDLGGDRPEWVRIEPVKPLPPLPASAPDGYIVDWPSGAHELLHAICASGWEGLLVAFDYGLDRQTVLRERPHGTGRTYSAHRMADDLLDQPGNLDITCHLIWDEMEQILADHGFKRISLLRQEAFFMRHSAEAIRAIIESGQPGFSRERQTLMELLHPDNMGRKFQVISAVRGKV
jgi:SAM-dependent MidA family methyltransferase